MYDYDTVLSHKWCMIVILFWGSQIVCFFFDENVADDARIKFIVGITMH